MQVSWRKYIEKTSINDPRPLLVEAVGHIVSRGSALDFGAGALVDSKFLLAEGFENVVALDNDEAAEERAREIVNPNFHFVRSTFEDYEYPTNTHELISGQYAFSFIRKEAFGKVMQKIFNSLKTGGVITGQIFGDRDEWNTADSDKSFLSKESFDNLFKNFEMLKFEEEEGDRETALGNMKHWHAFHFIAKKV